MEPTVERGERSITIVPPSEVTPSVPLSFSGLNRIPVLLLGPLLHLTGEAFVPRVGGDQLGSRPVDFHVDVLRALGAEVDVSDEGISARCSGLRGGIIELPYPSVGATESALLSAALADGKSVIRGAATEPEVLELAFFLQRMGARIELSPDRRIVIEGVPSLHGARTRLQGDRNEAFSYLVAGLLTGGQVRVVGCGQDRLVTAITTLMRMGAVFDVDDDGLTAFAPDGLRAAVVHTEVHPGFMTDWQTPLMVLFTQAEGMSVLHETVYEDRFVYVPALQADGRRDRAVLHLPRWAGLPVPRDELPAFRGRAGRVEAPGSRGADPRRAGRVLERDRGRGRGGAVPAARRAPPRTGLPPPGRAAAVSRARPEDDLTAPARAVDLRSGRGGLRRCSVRGAV